jgi:hypothetical protein
MRASPASQETGIGIVTETAIVTATVTATVDSTGGMEGLKRMDHLLEETVSEWASQPEMIEGVLGMWQHFYKTFCSEHVRIV